MAKAKAKKSKTKTKSKAAKAAPKKAAKAKAKPAAKAKAKPAAKAKAKSPIKSKAATPKKKAAPKPRAKPTKPAPPAESQMDESEDNHSPLVEIAAITVTETEWDEPVAPPTPVNEPVEDADDELYEDDEMS